GPAQPALPDRGRPVPPRVDPHRRGQAPARQLPPQPGAGGRSMSGDRGGEDALVRAIRELTARAGAAAGVTLGIGDDCAVLEPRAGAALLATTDLPLEDVHFRRPWAEPAHIGRKTPAGNPSDFAAMGRPPPGALG